MWTNVIQRVLVNQEKVDREDPEKTAGDNQPVCLLEGSKLSLLRLEIMKTCGFS